MFCEQSYIGGSTIEYTIFSKKSMSIKEYIPLFVLSFIMLIFASCFYESTYIPLASASFLYA